MSAHSNDGEENDVLTRSSCSLVELSRSGELVSPVGEINDAMERTILALREELRRTKEELRAKSAKCAELELMQSRVDSEISELTSSLFEEAYKLANDEEAKRTRAEKYLAEANDCIEVLQAEISALKRVISANTDSPRHRVFGSTSASPLVRARIASSATTADSSSPARRLSATVQSFVNGFSQSKTPPEVPLMERQQEQEDTEVKKQLEFTEIDPIYHKDLCAWRSGDHDLSEKEHPFLRCVYVEEILPCLAFQNVELATLVLKGIESNSICIEKVNSEKTIVRQCALSLVPRVCRFRFRLIAADDDSVEVEWHYVSQLCRNRIAAVCDFFTYLRYLKEGIVRCGAYEAYWEIIKLRKNMCLARLGLGFISSSHTGGASLG